MKTHTASHRNFRPRNIRTRGTAAVAALLALTPAALLRGAERYFVDLISPASFGNPASWSLSSGGASGASVPLAADTANFDQAGTYTVEIGAAQNNLVLEVENGSVTFNFGAGVPYTVTNNIRIGINAGPTSARLTLIGGTLAVNNTGDQLSIGENFVDGFLTVTTGAAITGNPDLFVGISNGDGTLTINNGGDVASNFTTLALSAASTGTVTVSGIGSRLTNAGNMFVGSAGLGTLTVQSGATISTFGTKIGDFASSIGNATVTGAGSTWTETGEIRVGDQGTGTLTISAGGAVTLGDTMTVASGATSFGTVNVTGTGSTLSMAGALSVGNFGQGIFSVGTGAQVSCGLLSVGSSNTANTDGTLTISGTGASLVASGQTTVGNGDTGSMTISNGGLLVSKNALTIGGISSGIGDVTVTGANARLNNTGILAVSNLGKAILTVSNGGAVTTDTLNVNDPAGGNFGTLNFDGGTITTGTLNRAAGATFNWSDGTLIIKGGSFNNAGVALTINGAEAGDLPTLHLQAGATMPGLAATTLTVGSSKPGALEVTGGSTVSVDALAIGSIDGGTGTVTIRGTLTDVDVATNIYLGGGLAGPGGAGTLTIEDGSTVTAGGVQLYGGGSVHLDGATLEVGTGIFFGTGGGSFDFVSGTIRFMGAPASLSSLFGPLLGPEHAITEGRTLRFDVNTSYSAADLVVDGGLLTAIQNLTLGINASLEVRGGSVGVGTTLTINSSALLLLKGGFVSAPSGVTNGGTIQLASTPGDSMLGGSLSNVGLITGTGQIAAGVTNNSGGRIRTGNGGHIVFGSGVANNGTGRVEVTPGGEIDFMITLVNNSIVDVVDGTLQVRGVLTNAASTGLITGRDAVLWFDGGLTNLGSLAFADGVNDVFGDINIPGGGRVIVSGGATAIFYDDVTNSGSINVSAAGGLASSAVFFGALSGAAPAGAGRVFIEGDARPGASPGIMAFGGDVSFGPFARTVIELGGTVPVSQYDRVTVAGATSFGGTLEVQLINGFKPSAGQVFDILDTPTQTGAFSTILLPPLSPGLFWRTERLYVDGTISVCPNAATFAEFAAFHGIASATADDDGDGESNALEFLLGQNPLIATQSGSPHGSLAAGAFKFEFNMPDTVAEDTSYFIETSTDLVAWTPQATRDGVGPWAGTAAAAVTLTPLGNCLEHVAIALTPGPGPRFFVRLRGQLLP